MPIYPHPQEDIRPQLIGGKGGIGPAWTWQSGKKPEQSAKTDTDISHFWSNWFVRLRDQVNLGETPAGIQDISATVEIQIPAKVTNILVRIQSATAGSVDLTANPQVEAGFDGQIITIEGQDNTKSVKLDTGDGLKLAGGVSFTLGDLDTITLRYNAVKSLWVEQTRSDNN